MPRLPLAAALALGAVTATGSILLPTNWHISPPLGPVATTGTMPQGVALSPDGKELAVVEAGVARPALRIFSVPSLQTLEDIPLDDAFGKPVWRDATTMVVAGGQSGRVLAVDLRTQKVRAEPSGSFIDAVTITPNAVVAVDDIQAAVDVAHRGPNSKFEKLAHVGAHPADALALPDGTIAVANKGESTISILRSGSSEAFPVDLHPAALALSPDGTKLYVACADADAIDVVDTKSDRVVQRINVGLPQGVGASPNALAVAHDGTLYVTLGAENAVAEIRNGKVVARVPTGWYPTGVAVDERNVYVSDGKGESAHANPQFDPFRAHSSGFVARLLVGSVRTIQRSAFGTESTASVLANIPTPMPTPPQTIVHPNGPIRHVIYIIRENRTYDQILGDLAGANGDPQLVEFGEKNTPNNHAIAKRFGIFDNTYADAQVSADGHNWSTAAFANDYLERLWPPDYGGRRKLYDFEDGAVASTPRNGYLWDDADRHHVSVRDYGEFVSYAKGRTGLVTTSMPGLKGRIDPHYPPFDLRVSDAVRLKEWKREFDAFAQNGGLPALEIIRLPNDHTSGTKPGAWTPQAYVAENDLAFGEIVAAVSHSRYWKSTAIFAIEDDAQNGPDHVSDQRTTFYLASPYASRGVHHAHYTTAAVLRTIELLLGLPPMSIYDAVASPLYDAFSLRPENASAYDALPESIDLNARNSKTAYGARRSSRMDWTHADRVDDRVLNDILAHVTGKHPK